MLVFLVLVLVLGVLLVLFPYHFKVHTFFLFLCLSLRALSFAMDPQPTSHFFHNSQLRRYSLVSLVAVLYQSVHSLVF